MNEQTKETTASNPVEAVLSVLDDWDVSAIKEHIKLNPNYEIKRGNVDCYAIYGKGLMWKAHIVCNDDVYQQVCDLAN